MPLDSNVHARCRTANGADHGIWFHKYTYQFSWASIFILLRSRTLTPQQITRIRHTNIIGHLVYFPLPICEFVQYALNAKCPPGQFSHRCGHFTAEYTDTWHEHHLPDSIVATPASTCANVENTVGKMQNNTPYIKSMMNNSIVLPYIVVFAVAYAIATPLRPPPPTPIPSPQWQQRWWWWQTIIYEVLLLPRVCVGVWRSSSNDVDDSINASSIGDTTHGMSGINVRFACAVTNVIVCVSVYVKSHLNVCFIAQYDGHHILQTAHAIFDPFILYSSNLMPHRLNWLYYLEYFIDCAIRMSEGVRLWRSGSFQTLTEVWQHRQRP